MCSIGPRITLPGKTTTCLIIRASSWSIVMVGSRHSSQTPLSGILQRYHCLLHVLEVRNEVGLGRTCCTSKCREKQSNDKRDKGNDKNRSIDHDACPHMLPPLCDLLIELVTPLCMLLCWGWRCLIEFRLLCTGPRARLQLSHTNAGRLLLACRLKSCVTWRHVEAGIHIWWQRH